jgi:hypothetical protein
MTSADLAKVLWLLLGWLVLAAWVFGTIKRR